MASSLLFKEYILNQLKGLDIITCKPMMGEFLLYYNGTLFGGIYDDRFLIKKTKTNAKYSLLEEIPYENAKPMYMVENTDNISFLETIIKETCTDLKK